MAPSRTTSGLGPNAEHGLTGAGSPRPPGGQPLTVILDGGNDSGAVARAPGRPIKQRLSVQQAPELNGYLAATPTPAAHRRRRHRGASRARR